MTTPFTAGDCLANRNLTPRNRPELMAASHDLCRSKIHFLTFEIYRSENDFYCGHSYIARYDERIRFNGKTNDRYAADRDLTDNSHVSFATRAIIRCVMCLAQYARLAYYSDILLMSVLSDYSYCIRVDVHYYNMIT